VLALEDEFTDSASFHSTAEYHNADIIIFDQSATTNTPKNIYIYVILFIYFQIRTAAF